MDKLLCFRGRSTPEAERDADATAWARYVCRAQAFSNFSGYIHPPLAGLTAWGDFWPAVRVPSLSR